MPRRAGDAISYQVSIRGRGLSALNDAGMKALIERHLSGDELPEGVKVSIQCWRAGRELDMTSNNPRAETLRTTFRRFLQEGRIELAIRADSENG